MAFATVVKRSDYPEMGKVTERIIVPTSCSREKQTSDESAIMGSEAPNLKLNTIKLCLPLEILCRVMELICDGYERDGIRMATIIVEDLLNVALSCPQFLASLPHAYRYLAKKMISPRQGTLDWD